MSIDLRKCYCCSQEKLLTEFVKDKYTKSGYKTLCLICSRVKSKEYDKRNADKRKAKAIKWKEENKQYWSDYCKYWRGTKDDFKPKERVEHRTREEAREFVKENKKRYDMENKEEITIWRKNNQDKINEKSRARSKVRRQEDPSYRIMENLRNRLKSVTRQQSTERLAEYDELFGCSLDTFRRWIESHFQEGMTWENWGLGEDKWNLDHHYPCCAFNLTNPEQQKQCFHYTNTYPMWCRENFSKGRTIPSSRRENIYIPDFAKNMV